MNQGGWLARLVISDGEDDSPFVISHSPVRVGESPVKVLPSTLHRYVGKNIPGEVLPGKILPGEMLPQIDCHK